MVVGRAEGEGGRGRGKRGPSKRGKKKGGEGRGGVQPAGVGLLVGGEQGVDDGGQQQVLLSLIFNVENSSVSLFDAISPFQIVFSDMGADLSDPSAITAPLRPAEVFKV